MSEPIVVVISDIHFNVNNLELATKALKAALSKAEELGVSLVIAGDLHDTKAIIRAEVANRLLEILNKPKVRVFIIVGNHDMISEKGDTNGLNYLQDGESVTTVSSQIDFWMVDQYVHMIPYQNTPEKFKDVLNDVPKGSIVICHQGVQGAHLGDYVQDKTSIEKEALEGYKIISGHYHRHQTVGALTYIGSPFTHTFGEANDGEKGFLILNSDGTYTREILKFRKHVKWELRTEDSAHVLVYPEPAVIKALNSDDLLWLKVTGPQSELNKLNKEHVGFDLLGHSNFKLDLVPLEADTQSEETSANVKLSAAELLDKLIDSMSDNQEQLAYLKQLWKDL